MDKLNSYLPDRALIKEKFRIWHVETLLNQSVDLLDRCLEQLKDYQSLDSTLHQHEIGLKYDEVIQNIDVMNQNIFDREAKILNRKVKYFNDSVGNLDGITFESNKLYGFGPSKGQGDAGHTRAGQNLMEKRLERQLWESDREITREQLAWALDDAAVNREKLIARGTSISEKRQKTESGAFAFKEQRDLLFIRLERDFKDAINRLFIVEEGLNKIYGYASDTSLISERDENIETTLNRVTIWARTALEWLLAYGQRDQGSTFVLSIRSVLGERAWGKLRPTSESISTSFAFNKQWLSRYENVRLKGISASILGNAGDIPWSLDLTLPNSAIYTRNYQEIIIDQLGFPNCHLGRVENRKIYRAPELCGQVSIVNASPISASQDDKNHWKVRLNRPEGSREKFSDIDDLVIEFNVVGVPILPLG